MVQVTGKRGPVPFSWTHKQVIGLARRRLSDKHPEGENRRSHSRRVIKAK